ncbi:MAG: sel1 repeat family protein [Cytophaga sp.]|nr:sel1 repeat family protein [Undibacterium sp.]
MLKLVTSVLFVILLGLSGCGRKGNFDAGFKAYERNDYPAALKEFKPLAESGHVEAQYYMGHMYHTSKGLPVDELQMVSWYRKAGEQGHARSQSALGNMYVYGFGVRTNFAEAAKWFLKAADQGDVDALVGLAYLYDSGTGVKKDQEASFALYSLARSKDRSKGDATLFSTMTAEQLAAGRALADRMSAPGTVSKVLAQR